MSQSPEEPFPERSRIPIVQAAELRVEIHDIHGEGPVEGQEATEFCRGVIGHEEAVGPHIVWRCGEGQKLVPPQPDFLTRYEVMCNHAYRDGALSGLRDVLEVRQPYVLET